MLNNLEVTYFYMRGVTYMNIVFETKYQIYLELALVINKEMYEKKEIPYYVFKFAEDELLKKLHS